MQLFNPSGTMPPMTEAPVSALKKTPLTEYHRAQGAQLVDFAGWEMPVSYTSVLDEHLAVRERAGLFDVSHMGRFFLKGTGAEAFLQRMTTNDVGALKPMQGQYTLALNERGGVRDDLIAFRLEDEFLVIMNAGNREKILDHFRSHLPADTELAHRSDDLAMIALQGPAATTVLEMLAPGAGAIERFFIRKVKVLGVPTLVSRTGYTGEDGFELYPESSRAVAVWTALLEAGKAFPVLNAGLGARDGLRTEVAYPLYGHEIDEDTSPWEAGLGWVVKPAKGEFLGRAAAIAAKESGGGRKLFGLTCAGPVPRPGFPLMLDGVVAGVVTSGTYSPCLKTGIALGYLPRVADPARGLSVVVRGRPLAAQAVKLPFYKSGGVAVVAKSA